MFQKNSSATIIITTEDDFINAFFFLFLRYINNIDFGLGDLSLFTASNTSLYDSNLRIYVNHYNSLLNIRCFYFSNEKC